MPVGSLPIGASSLRAGVVHGVKSMERLRD